MPQHDLHIDNQTTPLFRQDLNAALMALASNASGPDEPSTTVAGMLWLDTTNSILKIRDEANADWLDIAGIDSTQNTFTPIVKSLRAVDGVGIRVRDAAGEQILNLVPATGNEVIGGQDNQKVVTASALHEAGILLNNPASITLYTESAVVDLRPGTHAVFFQLSGGGGGGAASTGYEHERDGAMLPATDDGTSGEHTFVRMHDGVDDSLVLELVGGGGGRGVASSEAPRMRLVGRGGEETPDPELNGMGVAGGQGVTFGATDQPANDGNNGNFLQHFVTGISNLSGRKLRMTIGKGGDGGNLKTPDGAIEGEKERPQGQAGQDGYIVLWIWRV